MTFNLEMGDGIMGPSACISVFLEHVKGVDLGLRYQTQMPTKRWAFFLAALKVLPARETLRRVIHNFASRLVAQGYSECIQHRFMHSL